MSYFGSASCRSAAATLAIAASATTLVILTGGFDLSAGARHFPGQRAARTNMPDTPAGTLLWAFIGVRRGHGHRRLQRVLQSRSSGCSDRRSRLATMFHPSRA